MIVSIMQPAYLPWLGYFDRIAKSDLHIVLDHVQMDHSSKTRFANRNRLRTPDGWCWLTVPLDAQTLHMPLCAIRLAPQSKWREKHWATISQHYRRAPWFAKYAGLLENAYGHDPETLVNLSRFTTDILLSCLGVTTPILWSSSMDVEGTKSQLILNICKASGASTYLSGPFGRDYLDSAAFAHEGIALEFHDYPHPTYRQVYPGFEPYLSALDLLLNHGPKSLDIITGDRLLHDTPQKETAP